MDGATQHNAALVQQATQAAAALNERAGDLQQAVGAFKLDDETAGGVAANMPNMPLRLAA